MKSLKVLYTNADNMMNKRGELELRMKQNDYDIIGITEIFPKNTSNTDIQLSEWHISGYNTFINI